MSLITYDPGITPYSYECNNSLSDAFKSFENNVRKYLLKARNSSFKFYKEDYAWWMKYRNATIRVGVSLTRVVFSVYMPGCQIFKTWTSTDGRCEINSDKLDRRLRLIHNFVEKNEDIAKRYKANQLKDQELRHEVRKQWSLLTDSDNFADTGSIGEGSRRYDYRIDPEGIVFRGIPPLSPKVAYKVMKLIQESK